MGAINRRKAWMLLLAVLLLASVVTAACSSGTNNNGTANNAGNAKAPSSTTSNGGTNAGEDAKVDPFTISVYVNAPVAAATPDNKIYKKIKDELGVTLDIETLVGDAEQKLGILIAGGEYADLITANTKLVDAKAVIPLEDLIEEHAPRLKEHYAPYWNRMKDSSDGHIYWLPNYGAYHGEVKDPTHWGPSFFIQKKVLKEFGYPQVKTLDAYFDLIRKYAEAHPQTEDGKSTIGFTSLMTESKKWPLFNPPQHLIGHPNDGGVVVKDGVAEIYANKDYAKRYYQALNGLYDEGLMDKEAFTQNYDQYMAKLSSGRVLGLFDQLWNFNGANNNLVAEGKIWDTYVGLPLVYDESITDYYRDRAVINLNNGFGISKDAKDPVRIIKFLDALMDEEWQKLLNWGEEGVDYMVDDAGMMYRTPEQRTAQADPNWATANKADEFFGSAPKIEGTYSDGNASSPGLQPGEFFDGLKPEDKELLQAYGFKTWTEFYSPPPQNPVYYPAWQIDLVQGSDAAVAAAKMDELSMKYLPRSIMSKPSEFDAVWEDYTKSFDGINVKAYEERINEQIAWRMENWASE